MTSEQPDQEPSAEAQPPGQPSPTEAERIAKRWTIGCFGLVAAAGVLAMLIFTIAILTSDSDDGMDEAAAELACEDFVRDRLKAPSTAQFRNTTATVDGEARWTVTGDVDAENSFGAPIRSSYECVLELSPSGEQWNLVSLTGLE